MAAMPANAGLRHTTRSSHIDEKLIVDLAVEVAASMKE